MKNVKRHSLLGTGNGVIDRFNPLIHFIFRGSMGWRRSGSIPSPHTTQF